MTFVSSYLGHLMNYQLMKGSFACIGQDNSAWSGVIGKHSLHDSSNDNGLQLLDFCAIHQLIIIGGTLFHHRDIYKGSWKSPDGRSVN